jgi:4-amino-4-deoxy-L-arabinose transferase-like glycosyltransferase
MRAAGSERRSECWLAGGLGLGVLAVLLATAPHYGLTYDEPIYTTRALRAGEWLSLLVTAPGLALQPENINRYWDATGDEQAGLMKLLGTLGVALTGSWTPALTALRTGTMLVVALLAGLMYLFLARGWGRLEGLLGVLGLLLLPRVFAHCHLATMDAPVMAFSFLAVAAFALAARESEPRRQWRWLVWGGIACGAALGCKANGFLVPVIVLPWLLLRDRRLALRAVVALAVLAPLVFFATWPWLWDDTLTRLARYFAFFGKHYPVAVTYFGTRYVVAPWHFGPVMLAITTPPLVLLGAVGGMVAGWRWPRGEGLVGWQRAVVGLMGWAVVVNLLPLCLPGSPKYNGERLMLPVFPPLALLAAVGIGALIRQIVQRLEVDARRRKLVAGLAVVLALTPLLRATADSYPWNLSYYNALIGGTAGAVAKGMEATYWGETYAGALPWLNQHAPPGAVVWANIPGFVTSLRMYQGFGMLREDLLIVGGGEAFAQADLWWVVNKPTELGVEGEQAVREGRKLFSADLDGVPLVWVFAGPRLRADFSGGSDD